MMTYILWIYAILIVVTDRLSKGYAEAFLWAEPITIVPGILSLAFSRNSGIAFSLPLTGIIQVMATVLVIIGMSVYGLWFDPTRKTTLSKFAYVSVASWALSNAFDRITVGKVVDFVSLKYFAIFNVADIFITFWAILLILSHIRHERANRK